MEEGAIWYAESRERVRVALDDDLRNATRDAVSRLRLTVAHGRIPPPLRDSPKCPRCALVSVCLPDEVSALGGSDLAPRPIAVPADEALPLVVQSQRARITKTGDTLKIADEERGDTTVRLIEVSDVALFGNVAITTPALAALMEREIPVTFHSHGGWFRGMTHGVGHRNVEVRTAQYRASFDEGACLRFARDLVAAKIVNQRTILRRNWRGDKADRKVALDRLNTARRSAARAPSLAALLGFEGDAAATYFRAVAGLLAPPATEKDGDGDMAPFSFEARNRRPPTDPVNAMLSLSYAMLTRHLTVALASVGLDPFRGLFHAPRHGRPALALDLMEPFRPVIADSVVLTAVNTGEVSAADFVLRRHRHRPQRGRDAAASSPPSSGACRRRPRTRCSVTVSACAACWYCRQGCSAGTCSASCHHAPTICPGEASRERRTDLHRHLRHRRCPALAPGLQDDERLRRMASALGLPVPPVAGAGGRSLRRGFGNSSRRERTTYC